MGSLKDAVSADADARTRSLAIADLERLARSAERLEKLLASGGPRPRAGGPASLVDLIRLIEDGLDESISRRRDGR